MPETIVFELDQKSKFPLVKVGGIWVQWLPVTKIQIEYFLSSYQDSAYGAEWYESILPGNPRISPAEIRAENYWQAFVTNILPEDCRRFASWMGQGYRLLQVNEWMHIYKVAKETEAIPGMVEQVAQGTSERVKMLLTRLEVAAEEAYQSASEKRTLAHQMMMVQGVIEYIYTDKSHNRHGGLGSTNKNLFSSIARPETGVQRLADERNGAKMRHFGFRLMRES